MALADLVRNAVDVLPEGGLEAKLKLGRPLRVKLGIDVTSPDIHVGRAIPLQRMRAFQDEGHVGVLIIGDYTTRIGDPSGRSAERPILSDEEIDRNAETYLEQAMVILDRDRTEVRRNGEWLSQLSYADVVRLARTITVARILERDDFQKRWKAQHPIALHELLYPLAQGYDSVALKADVELGGTDQLFNLLVGRDLMRAEGLEPQVVMTLPLLVGTDGVEKMSKSLGNAIGVLDAPSDMFGRVMSIPDALLWNWYELLTDEPLDALAALRRRVEDGSENPRDAKARLGRLIVAQFHGPEAAGRAEEDFRRAFSRGEVPDDVETRSLSAAGGAPAAKTLVALGLAASMREARRKIAEGALKVYADGADAPRDVRDPDEDLAAGGGGVLRLGRRFIRVAWSK